MAVQEALAWGHVADAVRGVDRRRLVRRVIDEFREHQLLIASGGIAFRVLLATVVGALYVMGLLGFFGLSEVWRSDIAPDLRSSVSDPAFRLLNDAALQVLEGKAFFWVTAGAAIADLAALRGDPSVRPDAQPHLRDRGVPVTASRAMGLDQGRCPRRRAHDRDTRGDQARCAAARRRSPQLRDRCRRELRRPVDRRRSPAHGGRRGRRTHGPTTDRPLHWVSFGSALKVAGSLQALRPEFSRRGQGVEQVGRVGFQRPAASYLSFSGSNSSEQLLMQ